MIHWLQVLHDLGVITVIPLMKDFVLQVGNLGAGKTTEMVGWALAEADETSVKQAERQSRVDAGELTKEQAEAAKQHDRESYLNFPLKMGILRRDCEAWAKSEEILGNKYRAMAYRDLPNHIHFIGRLEKVPKGDDWAGVHSVSPNLYTFLAQRRKMAEDNALPDEDEGRDYLGVDEAQDLLRSRRSGNKYVKLLSEHADFFRKMGLEVQYQGPQQSQMDKNFRGKTSKKVLAEKYEYVDKEKGPIDPDTQIHFYYLKFTVFDTSTTEAIEKKVHAVFFMPYQWAKIVHRYYGTNVFQSESLTTRDANKEFLQIGATPMTTTSPPAEGGELVEEDGGEEGVFAAGGNQLLIEVAQNVASMAEALENNVFFTMGKKQANAILNNPLLTMKTADIKKLLAKLSKVK